MTLLEDELRKLKRDRASLGTWQRALRALKAGSFADSELLDAHQLLVALGPLPEGFCGPRRREMVSIIETRLGRKLGGIPEPNRPAPENPKPLPARASTVRRAAHTARPEPLAPPDTPKPAPLWADDLRTNIRREVERREIAAVLHFTRASNLPTIAAHGILPRALLQRRGIPYSPNDALRLDGTPDASSVSIGWPNYRMLFHYQSLEPEETWAVLEILPDVLWENACAFSWTNAASGLIRSTPLPQRKSVQAFTEMFVDHPSRPLRCRCQLEPCWPTDPQAEVLVFGAIPASMIVSIHTSRRLSADSASGGLASLVVLDGKFFGPRHDYAQWQKPQGSGQSGIDG